MITAQTSSPAAADADADPGADPTPERAALVGAIDTQAHRMDQLSAAIVRATAQVTWSGRAAEQFRARAAERSRECLQLAVALRASAERVHAAAIAAAARPAAHAGRPDGGSADGRLSAGSADCRLGRDPLDGRLGAGSVDGRLGGGSVSDWLGGGESEPGR